MRNKSQVAVLVVVPTLLAFNGPLLAIPVGLGLLAALGAFTTSMRTGLVVAAFMSLLIGGMWLLTGGYCELGIPGDCS